MIVNKLTKKADYFFKTFSVGDKKDFAEFCHFVAPWKVNLVVAGVIIKDQKILLVKPKNRTKFYSPGGLLDFKEDPKRGCLREIEEELGVKGKIIALLSPTIHWNVNKARKESERRVVVVFKYLVKVNTTQLKIVKGCDRGSLAELRWFSKSELESKEVMEREKESFKEALKVYKRNE